MKKTAAILKVLLLVLFAVTLPLAAEQAPGEIVIKALAYGYKGNEEGQAWIRIIDKFERENPNIDIQYDLLYDEVYHRRVAKNLARGGDAIPDIAYMGADPRWGAPWKAADQQFDHRPYLDGNQFDLQLIPPMGPNGEIWEIPLSTSNICSVLFMNEELVQSLGFSAPRTYEDLAAMVPKARAKGLEVCGIA